MAVSFIFFNPFIFLALSAFGTRHIPRGYFLPCKVTFPLICLKCNRIQFQRPPCLGPSSPLCTSDKGQEQKEENKNRFASSRLWESNFLCPLGVRAVTWPQTQAAGRGPPSDSVYKGPSHCWPGRAHRVTSPRDKADWPERWPPNPRLGVYSQVQRNRLGWLLPFSGTWTTETPRKWVGQMQEEIRPEMWVWRTDCRVGPMTHLLVFMPWGSPTLEYGRHLWLASNP